MPLKSGVSLVHLDEDVRTFVANTSTDPVPVQVVGGPQNVNIVNEVEVKNDAGTPLAVSGSVSVSNFPATQAVSDGGGSLTVDGSVSVNNHPASQSVVGAGAAATAQRVQLADESLAALESITATVSGAIALDSATLAALESITVQNGAGAAAVNIQDGGNSITVDGTIAVNNFPATQAVSATDLDIRNLSSAQDSVSVTGSVSVSNFPATQSVSGTVALDSTTLAALETINVGNFPATQAVSGTVTANLGTLNGAATAANQTTTNTTLASLDNKTPDESGVWGYSAGVSGTVTVAANKRILAITATAGALVGATMTINGGQTITIPAGTSITITPRANLTAPTLVFTSTASYFVEFIE